MITAFLGTALIVICAVLIVAGQGCKQDRGSLCPYCSSELIDNVYYVGNNGAAMRVCNGKRCPKCRYKQKQTEDVMEERIIKIIKDQLFAKSVKPNDLLIEDLGADSLDRVELVMCLEEEFDISISDDEAQSVVRVRDVVDMVNRKLADNGDAGVCIS